MKLTRREKSLVVLLGCVGILALGIQFGVLPAWRANRAMTSAITELNIQWTTLQGKVDSLEGLTAQHKELIQQAETVAEPFLEPTSPQRLDARIHQLLSARSLDSTLLVATAPELTTLVPYTAEMAASDGEPGQEQTPQGYALPCISFTIGVEGSYGDALHFLDDVRNEGMGVRVDQFSFQPAPVAPAAAPEEEGAEETEPEDREEQEEEETGEQPQPTPSQPVAGLALDAPVTGTVKISLYMLEHTDFGQEEQG